MTCNTVNEPARGAGPVCLASCGNCGRSEPTEIDFHSEASSDITIPDSDLKVKVKVFGLLSSP